MLEDNEPPLQEKIDWDELLGVPLFLVLLYVVWTSVIGGVLIPCFEVILVFLRTGEEIVPDRLLLSITEYGAQQNISWFSSPDSWIGAWKILNQIPIDAPGFLYILWWSRRVA